MYDASAKSYEENFKETKEIVKIAHAAGVSVEAELGHIFTSALGGGEGRGAAGAEDYASLDDCYTDPATARKFVEGTGVDALAISFGMHGGSGVSDEDFKTAIRNGITKINYYTYGSMAGGNAVRALIAEAGDEKVFYHDIAAKAKEAIKADVKAAMTVFASSIL